MSPTRFRVVVDLAVVVELAGDIDFVVVVELAVDINFVVVDSAVVVGDDCFEVFVDVE